MKEHLKIYFNNQINKRFAIRLTTGIDTAFPANQYNLFVEIDGNL